MSLSTPNRDRSEQQSVVVDFGDEDVSVTIKRPLPDVALRIVATKQTIAAAVLMHHIIGQRGPDYAVSIVERAGNIGKVMARRDSKLSREMLLFSEPCYPPETTRYFREFLEISEEDIHFAGLKTAEAFDFLEAEGLAIDPACTPEMMVLVGLIPMSFSVRTPKGERIYREIKVNAPLWSLDLQRGTKNGRPFTDVEFKFRGIEIVRRAITTMAIQYLEAEEEQRRKKGQPLLKRKAPPDLDEE